MDVEMYRSYCLSLPLVTEDMPFDDTVLVFRLKRKIFACLFLDKPNMGVMKCDPEKAIELREQFNAVEGAYHWNKKYWNQIFFNQDVDDELIMQLLEHAWDEVNKKLPKKDRVVK